MISPSKILLLALFATAFASYFGDRLVSISQKVSEKSQDRVTPPDNDLVYAKTNHPENGGSVRVPMDQDGHYWITLDINDIPVRFVVDTGASHISLSYADASKAGLDPDNLKYNRVFKTANGDSYKAIIQLDRVSLDAMVVTDIAASVSPQGRMDVSLLGMNFLNKMSSFKVENGELVLRP